MWSDIELEVGIVCACLPSLRALLIPLFKKRSEVTAGRSSNQGPRGKRNTYHTIGSKDTRSHRSKGKMGLADVTLNSNIEYDEEAPSEPRLPLSAYHTDVPMVPMPAATTRG